MYNAGLRVVRGEDWKLGNEDSGEGHLGTVIRLGNPESKTVAVCWDNGNITEHRVGHEDPFYLRIFDNAPVGVRHPGVTCDGCKEENIIGFRFKCIVCEDIDFCTHCYMNEKSHDPTHVFGRFDTGEGYRALVSAPPTPKSKGGGRSPRSYCDECGDTIIGFRFKCLNCLDFDFCILCYINDNSHDPTHVFGRLDIQKDSITWLIRLRSLSGKVGARHSSVICGGCDDEITDLRYVCLHCPDFDFCRQCYKIKASHNPQHAFGVFNMTAAKDSIAYKLPLRAQSRNVTAKGIFEGAIVVRGIDWAHGEEFEGGIYRGSVLAIDSSHRGSAEVGFRRVGKTSGVFNMGLNGLVELKFVVSSSNGTYYPDHLPRLEFKSIVCQTKDPSAESESSEYDLSESSSSDDKSEQSLRYDVDENVRVYNDIRAHNNDARENAHLEFVSVMYKDKMEKVLANPRSIPEPELDGHHKIAIEFCLEAVSKVKPLTEAIIRKVKDQVGHVYAEYKAINTAKLISNAPAIGIDLGTTYCCVAVYRNEEIDVVPNSVGKNTTPSYVVFKEEEIIVGNTAKDKAYLNPQETIYDVKRMCGRHFDEEKIQKLRKYWPFTIVKGDDGKIQIEVQKKYLLPEQVITEILTHLKHTADEYLVEPVINAVVTVPAYFSPRQRALTKDACNKAGLNVLQFISEPAAAAVAYGLHLKNENAKRSCLIFDLGGGTFDVAVLKFHKKKIKIKAIDGDPFLGGEDFDNSMIEYCLEAFKREHGIDLMTEGTEFIRDRRLKRIKAECEIQKCYLSAARQVKVTLHAIHGEISLVVPFTRDIFSELIKPSVDKCMEVVDQILRKCEMKEIDIDDIMVVGGSSRIPYVQSRLSEKFEGKPLLKRVTPEEAVAHGAAILAFNIENPDAGLPSVFIQDSNFRPLLDVP